MNSVRSGIVAPRALSPLILSCLAATWFIWGSTYLVIRIALAGFPPFFLMATRFLATGAMLLAWQLVRGAALPAIREWRNATLVGTLMLGGGMGGTAYAEQTIASGLVVSCIAVIPLLLVVIMLTRGAGIRGSPAGLTAIALGTSGWALGSVLSQRGFRLAPGATGFATEMLCGGLALLAVSAVAGEPWHWPSQPGLWIAWAYLVVFGSLIAFNAYMLLLERTSAGLAASYTLVNPVVALLLGVTLGAEAVSAWEWLAAGVVMLAVLILLLARKPN
jgi:drug/metabolite transporter (DMT)-like permease